MNALDAVSGSSAECYITIEGNRYNFMQLTDFESSVEHTITEVSILGKSGKGHKPSGWKGAWKATAHYNQSVMRELLFKYKEQAISTAFDIQVTNEDPTSAVGRQTIIHKGCLTKGGILAKFNADEEILSEELEGTFDDWEMPEKFSLLSGMN